LAKPIPKRIPSDGCGVQIDGEVCYPHEGEWVELVTHETVGEMRARVAFARLGAELDGVDGGPREVQEKNEIWDHHHHQLCRFLARRVLAWNWTDDGGAPLPPPRNAEGEPDGLLCLRASELYWLMTVTGGEREADRKNG
jgi:hypothetical protein